MIIQAITQITNLTMLIKKVRTAKHAYSFKQKITW